MTRTASGITTLSRAFSVAAVLAVISGSIQAQEMKVPTPHQHGLSKIIHTNDDGSATSTNWSGYAVPGNSGSFSAVTGSWTVPVSRCTFLTPGKAGQPATLTPPAYASFWVGIDGWGSNTVEQIGTDSDCSSGVPSYYAWYEFYPQPSYYAGALTHLSPGDTMTATVAYNGRWFTATISDTTKGSSFTTTYFPNPAAGTPSRSSVEWIAEAPSSSSGILPLANFGSVYFTSSMATMAGSGGAAATSPIGGFANVSAASMVSEVGARPMATPSALTSSSSFYVTWYNVGP